MAPKPLITNISHAKAQLSRLITEVERGRKVLIGRAGRPVAMLVPYTQEMTERRLGGKWEGRVSLAKDFDDLPAKLMRAFKGGK